MSPHDERRRIEHGFWWGVAATAASGVIVLLAMALGPWPGARPLAVQAIQMFGHDYLGREGPSWAAYLLGGVLQLGYGGLCGALLALVTERVTFANALGLGALRWFNTQVVVLPALGFGDLGWLAGWSPVLITALPHLAYAITLGWLMHQEDEGHEPIPLHFRNGHLVWVSQRGRG